MSELIRKAVELADGWEVVGDCLHPPRGKIAMAFANPSTWIIDALAAQLVRQVDALEGMAVESMIGYTSVCNHGSGVIEVTVTGDDRTLNTITAIVESGVLEEVEE